MWVVSRFGCWRSGKRTKLLVKQPTIIVLKDPPERELRILDQVNFLLEKFKMPILSLLLIEVISQSGDWLTRLHKLTFAYFKCDFLL